MKASHWVLVVALSLVIGLVALVRVVTPLEEWAMDAPLEKVTVRSGQTVDELIRTRVPASVRARGDMTFAVSVIGDRQTRQLGNVQPGEDILLPIPYNEWRK